MTSSATDRSASGAHVLLVEDSALVVGALRILLEDAGFEVSEAATVRQAVTVAEAGRPDVILLDLTLPDGDGMQVLSRLQASGWMPRVAVALTGHDDDRTRERCLRAGCRDVLVKPIQSLKLPGQIRGWLGDAGAAGRESTGAGRDARPPRDVATPAGP